MALIIKSNLKLSDIPEERIFTSEKTGKRYLPVTIVVNNELNNFETQGPIYVEQTKEERLAKEPKIYLGDTTVVFNDLESIITTKTLIETNE